MKKLCEQCNTEFDAKRSTAKYCSDKCRVDAARGTVTTSPGYKPQAKIDPRFLIEKKPYDREANLAAFQKMGLDPVTFITTGVADLDALTQIPRGRVTQIQGPHGVGKTTLCLNMIAGMEGLKVLYIDTEAALNAEVLTNLGIEAKDFTLYNDSAFIEDIYDVIIDAVSGKKKYDLIIFDSLAACTFRVEAAGGGADANIGQKAKVVGKLMRIIPMELKRTKTALVIINQERETIGGYGPIKYTPGGMGPLYAASLILKLTKLKADRFPKSGPPFKGQGITAEVDKTKVNSTMGMKAKFNIYYGGLNEGTQISKQETTDEVN